MTVRVVRLGTGQRRVEDADQAELLAHPDPVPIVLVKGVHDARPEVGG